MPDDPEAPLEEAEPEEAEPEEPELDLELLLPAFLVAPAFDFALAVAPPLAAALLFALLVFPPVPWAEFVPVPPCPEVELPVVPDRLPVPDAPPLPVVPPTMPISASTSHLTTVLLALSRVPFSAMNSRTSPWSTSSRARLDCESPDSRKGGR